MLDNFCRGDIKLPIEEFVLRASAFPHYFDTIGIREEAKREIAILERRAAEEDVVSPNSITMWAIDVPEKYR
jgi:hypothetical protein